MVSLRAGGRYRGEGASEARAYVEVTELGGMRKLSKSS